MGQAPETMSVTFSFGLEPDLRLAEGESGGVCFSVPPCPIGAKSLQKIHRTGRPWPGILHPDICYPGRGGFHNSDRTRSTILGIDQSAAQGVRVDQRRGHFAVFMRSDQFLQELVARVRPLALAT